MPKVVKSINELNIFLEKKVTQAMEQRISMALKMAQKDIGECIQEAIDEYYKEKVFLGGTSATPLIYERTYKLLNSMIKTDIVRNGNTFSCEVGISDDYLNYQYPGNPDRRFNLPATGRDILDWNSADGSHGGTVDGDWKIWDEAMRTLGGETGIMAIFVSKLKKCGIKVK